MTGYAFTIKREYYRQILSALYQIKKTHGDLILAEGYPVPELPLWGRKGDITEFHLENEYEILAISFRAEVESFLIAFDKHYNFLTGTPRSTDLIINEPSRDPPPHLPTTPSMRSIREEANEGSRRPSPVDRSETRLETGGPRDRRQSNLYNFGSNELSNRLRRNHPEGSPHRTLHTNKLKEVLGDSRVPTGDRPDSSYMNRPTAHSGRARSDDLERDSSSTRIFQSRNQASVPPNHDASDLEDEVNDHGRLPRDFGKVRKVKNQIGDPYRNVAEPIKSEAKDSKGLHFEDKLKLSDVPQWDGNTDTIILWLSKINNLARYSAKIHDQLGSIVPRRLQGAAEGWYWSLPLSYRNKIEVSWTTLKAAISRYYMNRKWLDKQKARATRAYYQEAGYHRETPSEYYIRKGELLNTVYSLDDSELILEIMEGAPACWNTILTTQLYVDAVEFQEAIRFHEDNLMKMSADVIFRKESVDQGYRFRNKETNSPRVHVHLVGSFKGQEPPKFPKDDSNVSRRGKTPEEKGARPCRHCGSGKHWDNECRHSFKGNRAARANLSQTSSDEETAQNEYDNLYYSLNSDSETEQDFHNPLRNYVSNCSRVASHSVEDDLGAPPEEGEIQNKQESTDYLENDIYRHVSPLKQPLNRRTRRKLAKEILGSTSVLEGEGGEEGNRDKGDMIELKRHMSRPPGCSFLGSKATQAMVSVGGLEEKAIKVIIDSGSDITLISESALEALKAKPKVKKGQKIDLIQVTGSTTISGYATLDLIFHTDDGPIKIVVEAYVVKGMTTPFILGNDFTDQYSISISRDEGECYLNFGKSGRRLRVDSSTGSSYLTDQGHTFKVRVIPNFTARNYKIKAHRKNQKGRRRLRTRMGSSEVRATERTVIPPLTSKLIPVEVHLMTQSENIFVEKMLLCSGNADNIFGSPDSMISTDHPYLHVSNFSSLPVTVATGQVLGHARNPRNWLDRRTTLSETTLAQAVTHANFIRHLSESLPLTKNLSMSIRSETEITSKAQRNATEKDDPLAEDPVEGGPKTSLCPEDDVNSSRLLETVDISPDLSAEQRTQIATLISRHASAFGLDGKLGNYPGRVEVEMKAGTTPISLPPFHASPANREVIDKQMDVWIELGVIEPSKSPWAAPVFIVYRNSKPRMVIDLRKFNERVIPDEFPLPKQEDILQALNGSQWLTTLDALSGFTQLTLSDSAAEKLAFRTHRGLWQFRRMPFGYRNGPAVFQRVMQNVLAPFLWIFALVYIDDIVVFSLTFEDHLIHLDKVFTAISQANITLSPAKCHFAFQSLLLLGQKVSRLGLSTHKEKVSAITQLDVPRNISELQTFLGMMVYFSSYVPFYAWIAHPFFQLLKKGSKWEWTTVHQEAFELCKEVLTNAPVRGYAMPNLPYRIYTDACDYGLAGILQQVQPIAIKDLKGTKVYDRLRRAFDKKEPIPQLVTVLSKTRNDVPKVGEWSTNFEDTIVHVERVVSYWSRVLKSAERNYSPTEREALALKEALIKFQPFLEGVPTLAITDHAALTWSRTFQNVNRRLLTWGTVFAAYPDMEIVHRAGKAHSNVDPVSRLRRRIPITDGPMMDDVRSVDLSESLEDPLKDMFAELGSRFEERLLQVASGYVASLEETEDCQVPVESVVLDSEGNLEVGVSYVSSSSYSILIGISTEELSVWKEGYAKDSHYSNILSSLRKETKWNNPSSPQYHYGENGLIYFEDWNGNNKLCVPKDLQTKVMAEVHDCISEGAHAGYYKTYNRIASTYYWPRMSRIIKTFVNTCDICQKAKPRRHAPVGLLRPIPIPTRPFEVVTMDFIPELPESNGFDNILVIVDKLTKYGIFIPCSTKITEEGTAKLFFKHIVAQYGLPQQVITDRDSRWRNDFWGEICRLMGTKRSLTTAYHPQADGQTEVLNQTLEIALRAYIGPSRNDWEQHLDALSLSYNSSPHTATTFAPAYLLRGFIPITTSTLINPPPHIPRPSSWDSGDAINQKAVDMWENFESDRTRAKEALLLSQIHQQKAYNKGRLIKEFDEGDLVVLNPHSLDLLKSEKGRGNKLLMRYDGPFEIIRKLSPVTYQLRLPASYGLHPILNIAHLEEYKPSPDFLGNRPTKRLNRQDFNELPEFEVEAIIGERLRKTRTGRRTKEFKVRFTGYGPEFDEWLPPRNLRNAPELLAHWQATKSSKNTKRHEADSPI